jgi:zinc/manganese transport system permease protein
LLLLLLNLVASIQAFGTLLAIGPVLLPAAAATCWTQRIWPMIVLNILFGLGADYVGLLLSYYGNIPSGPSIVLSNGVLYGLSLAASDRLRLFGQTAWGGH